MLTAIVLHLSFRPLFDKKFLFDAKIIKQGEKTVKEKSRAESKGTEGVGMRHRNAYSIKLFCLDIGLGPLSFSS